MRWGRLAGEHIRPGFRHALQQHAPIIPVTGLGQVVLLTQIKHRVQRLVKGPPGRLQETNSPGPDRDMFLLIACASSRQMLVPPPLVADPKVVELGHQGGVRHGEWHDEVNAGEILRPPV